MPFRHRRADRAARHRLGDGAAGVGPPGRGSRRLAAVLKAASAGAQAHELAGEEAAVAAFHAARAGNTRRPAARRPIRPSAGVVAWISAVAVAATAGAALAAGSPPAGPPAGLQSKTGPSAAPTSAPAPAAARSPGAIEGRVPPSPAASHVGLCRSYLANAGDRGKALATGHRRELAEAAGGADRVDAYCRRLAGAEPVGPDQPKPGKDGGRTGGGPSRSGRPAT
jgi:hypothetical protein